MERKEPRGLGGLGEGGALSEGSGDGREGGGGAAREKRSRQSGRETRAGRKVGPAKGRLAWGLVSRGAFRGFNRSFVVRLSVGIT